MALWALGTDVAALGAAGRRATAAASTGGVVFTRSSPACCSPAVWGHQRATPIAGAGHQAAAFARGDRHRAVGWRLAWRSVVAVAAGVVGPVRLEGLVREKTTSDSHRKSAISYSGRISISLGPGMGLGQRFTQADRLVHVL